MQTDVKIAEMLTELGKFYHERMIDMARKVSDVRAQKDILNSLGAMENIISDFEYTAEQLREEEEPPEYEDQRAEHCTYWGQP